nr:hypothetical protein [Candidatus Sigynarchaeota archaeon]
MARKTKKDKRRARRCPEHGKDNNRPVFQPVTNIVAEKVKEVLSIVKWLALDDDFLDRVLQIIPIEIKNHESTKFLVGAIDKNITSDGIPAILDGVLDLLCDMDCFSHIVALLAEMKKYPSFIQDIKNLVPI